ncbi:hypothetical protein [Pseudonocardia alni]|uniref:hypothetical protein n=1 Tax=Pseudonocardia alni TaxID=33907 RepID=UPI00280B4DF6|nr:hypothetical protein [Pseudonocardia alni]
MRCPLSSSASARETRRTGTPSSIGESGSIRGLDVDRYYAQLTPNGVDDADGPQIWIAPPTYVIGSVTDLVRTIAAALDLPPGVVDQAMAHGLAMSRGEPIV